MMASAPKERTSTPDGRGQVLIGLMLTMALSAMDSTIVATVIPSIVRDLSGFTLFPWVFSAYLLANAVANPIYGKLADLFGRKPVLLTGTAIFLLGSLLSGAAWGMVALILFRFVQGLGAAAILSTSSTVVGDLYSLEERGRIQGWLSSVWGVAAVIGPAIGGFFAVYASWRWIFYINLPIGIAAMFMVGTRLHENVERRRRPRIDYAGIGLLVGAVGLFIFGLLEGGVQWAWLSAPSLSIFAAAALLLVAFIWQERRAPEPVVSPWVFGRRTLVGANVGAAVVGLLTIGLTSFLPTYAQGVLGASPVVAGFALATLSISWPLASAFSARFYLRLGFRDTALVGVSVCLAAAAFFGLLPESVPVVLVGLGSFLMGIGLGLLSTSLLVGVQSVVGWSRRGEVTAANVFTRMLGSTVGAAIFGSIATAALASRLRAAPASLRGLLPASLNDVTTILTGERHASPAVVAYLRDALNAASHGVFWALAAVAVLGLGVLLVTPRVFAPLPFATEEAQETVAAEPDMAATSQH